ncbi:MAG: acyl carrier protein [Bacteriovoracaceae bacterium]
MSVDDKKKLIFNDLLKIFDTKLNINSLQMDSDLNETLKLDSIQLLTLVTEIENHYSINLPVSLEHNLNKVSDLVDLIFKELNHENFK